MFSFVEECGSTSVEQYEAIKKRRSLSQVLTIMYFILYKLALFIGYPMQKNDIDR